MRPVFILCNLGLKEYLRRKIFVVMLLMMFIVAGTGLLSNPFTIGTHARLMRDIALLFIQLLTLFFGMALGATALPNEIERKTLYTFLAKPISRGQLLWGKFLAIASLIFANALLLGVELYLVLFFSVKESHLMILAASLLIGLEAVVVAGFSLWFSTFMTVPVTLAASVLLIVVGSLSHAYTDTLTADNPLLRWILTHAKSLIPYFDYLSIRSAVTHDYAVSPAYLAGATLYGVLFVGVAMLLADAFFSWKDL